MSRKNLYSNDIYGRSETRSIHLPRYGLGLILFDGIYLSELVEQVIDIVYSLSEGMLNKCLSQYRQHSKCVTASGIDTRITRQIPISKMFHKTNTVKLPEQLSYKYKSYHRRSSS